MYWTSCLEPTEHSRNVDLRRPSSAAGGERRPRGRECGRDESALREGGLSMSSARSAAQRPIFVAIGGDSGSGKSTLAAGFYQIFGKGRITTLCLDDYHSLDRRERRLLGVTALDPRANNFFLMESQLLELKRGRPITKPVYDHRDGTFGQSEELRPREVVIVQGLHPFLVPGVRAVAVSACGLAGIPLRTFLPGLIVGSTLFLSVHFFLGYLGGSLLAVTEHVLPSSLVVTLVLVLLVAAFALWVVAFRRQRAARQELEAASLEMWHEGICPACIALYALSQVSTPVS